ncbi:MAG: choice-of-anchor J domain-containing protein [Bacteroidia bacterium]|nr:choice-of-anchor J domain-containing protein [Bacteroidia bacterium]
MRTFSQLYASLTLACLGLFCLPLSGQDIGVQAILQPTATVCGGKLLPQVLVKNYGPSDITSLRLNYVLDGVLIANFNWLGTLGPNGVDTVTYPSLNLPLGVYTLQVYSSDPNFSFDVNGANDTLQQTFEVTKSTGENAPFFADFDSPGFPYSGYIVNNPDAGIGWQRSEGNGYLGGDAIYMNNYNYDAIGQVDEITIPGTNLSQLNKPGLSFFVSYAPYGINSGFADTLEVYVSGDCGVTFERVYQKFGTDLATSSPTTGEFFPRASYDWRQEWVDISDYFESTFFVVRFRHVNNYENNLFLDRIRVQEIFALDTEDELASGFSLSASTTESHIEVLIGDIRNIGSISLMDVHGREVYRSQLPYSTGQQQHTISAGQLVPGVYYIRVQGDVSRSIPVIWK